MSKRIKFEDFTAVVVSCSHVGIREDVIEFEVPTGTSHEDIVNYVIGRYESEVGRDVCVMFLFEGCLSIGPLNGERAVNDVVDKYRDKLALTWALDTSMLRFTGSYDE